MRRLLTAALAVTAAATAGCGGGTSSAAPTRPAVAAVHSPASGPGAAGTPALPATAEPALGAVAVRYLQARENAISYTAPYS